MIALALMLASGQAAGVPPCKNGKPACKPWERAWPSDPAYSVGPFNLILRWGNGLPIVIHYENRDRCELAALQVDTQGGLLGKALRDDGTVIEPESVVSGANTPWAFCIPA